ncbi:DUF2564 family protein [Metabacillus litoralis]|uniref:DUF2564 family protein n=1 Tax=Metabacillus litoralis TaxID=152268 RepID=A0A5C6W5G4_9BACI|nr:DUF2564 family protein [Metabacillus litoralis]TXC93217.1 DUF2564 family protein [Metabacillus litoralis]
MDQINHTGLISGMNDISQLEAAVKSAQKMVGSATMQLDPEALEHAENAINDAKEIMNRTTETGVDQLFISKQKKLLEQCEHQLSEAKQ